MIMTMIAIVPKNPTNTRGTATVVAVIALLALNGVETPLVLGVCTEGGVPVLEPWVDKLVPVDTVVCAPVDCVDGSVDGTAKKKIVINKF